MKNVKILSVLLLILSIISFFLTFILFTTRENEKEKRLIAEEENTLLLTKNEELTLNLDDLKITEKELNRKISKLVKEKDDIDKRYDLVENERDNTLDELSMLKRKLENEKKSFLDYKLKTADIVSEFKEQNEKLLMKVEKLESQLNLKGSSLGVPHEGQRAITSISSTPIRQFNNVNVELPKVIVTPQTSNTGKVIVVNKRYNFVICNLGTADGIVINDKVGVFRGTRRIADAIVEKVYDNLSASGIKNVRQGFSIQEGDIVKIFKT